MNIEQARELKAGDKVRCPADRGEPGYSGTVENDLHQTSTINKNYYGVEYVWVSVRRDAYQVSGWPSNRLG